MAAAAPHSGTALVDVDDTADQNQNQATRKPIVSIHGHDVND